jgi:hypothetical protein
MEPRQPNFNEEYTTPVHSTETVDPKPSHVHPIWRTPSSQDIYEKNNFGQQLFDPPLTYFTIDMDVEPLGQLVDHPCWKNNQYCNHFRTSRE